MKILILMSWRMSGNECICDVFIIILYKQTNKTHQIIQEANHTSFHQSHEHEDGKQIAL